MISLKNYKIFLYLVLALVVIVSFAITNLLLNLIVAGKVSSFSIVYIILVLLLNFAMFFMVFRFAQQLLEKDATIQELANQIKASKEIKEEVVVTNEVKELNINEIIDKLIPPSPQSLTIENFSETILANISKVSELVQGVFFIKNRETGEFEAKGKYAYYSEQVLPRFKEGETIPGQVAKDKKLLNITNIPQNHFVVISGLGKGNPGNLIIIPILDKDETIGIVELATFKPYDKEFERLFEKLSVMLGKILVKIKA
jgi:hypothetical protein